MALFLRKACKPSKPGKSEFETVGVLTEPIVIEVPSACLRAIGNVQSYEAAWDPWPTPLTFKGLDLLSSS